MGEPVLADSRPVGAVGTERTCIVMNAGSGRKGANGAAEAVRGYVADRAERVELRTVEPGQDIAAICRSAVESGFGTVVAAGGDGTIGGVAACLAGSGRRMGVVPLGTFNYFARANGIPEDPAEALAALDAGRVEPRHAAYVNGKLFLNNASVGIYPQILASREAIYRRWGRSRIAAYWSVIKTVGGFRRSRRMKVTVDGRMMRVKTPLVFVAFNAYQLDIFGIEGADRIRDGEFAVLVAPDCGRLGLLRFAALLLLRGMRRGKDFELLHGSEVEIDNADGRHDDRLIARDGEKEWMEPPLRLTIDRDALQLVVPDRSAEAAGPSA